jgi:hypothetical protein
MDYGSVWNKVRSFLENSSGWKGIVETKSSDLRSKAEIRPIFYWTDMCSWPLEFDQRLIWYCALDRPSQNPRRRFKYPRGITGLNHRRWFRYPWLSAHLLPMPARGGDAKRPRRRPRRCKGLPCPVAHTHAYLDAKWKTEHGESSGGSLTEIRGVQCF